MKKVKFIQMKDGTKEDYLLLDKHEKEFIGLPSRIFQHEYDHMEGTDFTHKVSKLKIERAMKKFNKTVKRLRNNPN